MQTLVANYRTSKVRQVTRNGRSYYVAPLTLIVPGVLNGSRGALYYPPEEIRRNFLDWNHVPLVVNHPVSANGENISAKDPDVLSRQGIGYLFKPYVTSDGRLKAEGWFDVEATRRVDRRVLNALEQGRQIELSTGLYTTNEQAPLFASYQGRPYQFIARDYRPDHLAILPDQVGACSLRDGCGVLVNTARFSNRELVINRDSRWTPMGNASVAYPKDCPYCGTEMEIDPDSGKCNRCGETVTPKKSNKPTENDCECKAGEACTCKEEGKCMSSNGWRPVRNAFCPTGEGGGQDNSCSSRGGSGGGGKDKDGGGEKDSRGRKIIADDVAERGATLADEAMSADNRMEGATTRRIKAQSSRLKRDQKKVPELKKQEEAAVKEYHAAQSALKKFNEDTGVSGVDAWEAHNDRPWPHYRVDSRRDVTPKYTTKSKAVHNRSGWRPVLA